jgi:hypothetical protein
MPPKRTPTKAKTPKGSKPRLITPIVHSRDSSADSSPDVAGIVNTVVPIVPAIPGISPEFMAYIQMQD